jgi:hypothetical protein
MAFPLPEDLELQRQVEDLKKKIETFDDWVLQFAARREGSAKPLPKGLLFQVLGMRRRARNLAIASSVPVALAIYGASQCGKSLLVGRLIEPKQGGSSALGLVAADPLADELSFVNDLNPKLATEATAVVTRFTLSERAGVPEEFRDYPVRARLFSAADILKALGRGFFTECAGETEWTEASMAALMQELALRYRSDAADPEWRADLLDAYEYLKNDIRHHRLKADPVSFGHILLNEPLTGEGYMKLASHLFWEDARPISILFENLWHLLTDTFRGVDSLLMAWHVIHFILDSNRTAEYESKVLGGTIKWPNVRLRRERGQRVIGYNGEGERPVLEHLQGIISELQIPLRRERLTADSIELFDRADVLDIPGARAGAGTSGLTKAEIEKEGPAAALHILKRGRVGLMFDKYADELQASVVLYLQASGNLEARGELAPQINRWGRARFRDRWPLELPPDESDAPSLFVGLTKMDLLLRVSPDPEAFQAWVAKELAEYFASWMNNYGGKGFNFKNVFPLRYPNTMDEPNPEAKFDLPAWRRAFKASIAVGRYVADAEQKWDAAFEAGNGGLKLLLRALLGKLSNEGRRKMLTEQARDLRGHLESLVRDLYVDPDLKQQVERRRRVAATIIDHLRRDTNGLLTRSLVDALHFDGSIADLILRELVAQQVLPVPPDYKGLVSRVLTGWQTTRDWAAVSSVRHGAGGNGLDEQTLTLLASYLVEYLSANCLEEIAGRLETAQRIGSPAIRQIVFRRYAEIVLDDFLLTPGPRPSQTAEPSDPPKARPHELVRARWEGLLADRLAAAVKGGYVEPPPGNEELAHILSAVHA